MHDAIAKYGYMYLDTRTRLTNITIFISISIHVIYFNYDARLSFREQLNLSAVRN